MAEGVAGGIAGLALGAFFSAAVAVILISLGLTALWIWMIVDCATRETTEGNTKLTWILVIIFVGWIGALIYFFARRQERIRVEGR